MSWGPQRILVAVEIAAIVVLSAFIAFGLLGWPPPVTDTQALSALDYWANRYQTLIAGILAILAASTAYGVARYRRRNELADSAKRERTEMIRSLHACTLEIQRVMEALRIYGQSVKHDLAAEREVEAHAFEPPSWITQTASTLPIAVGPAIFRFYLAR